MRSACLALAVLLLPCLCQPQTLTTADKKQLVVEIEAILHEKAFASTVDFLSPKPLMDIEPEELERAKSNEAFADLVAKRFGRYHISHLDLWTPEYVASRDANSDVGPGIAARKDTDGKYIVHEVFPGSAAESAGLKLWDKLVLVDDKPIKTWADINGPTGTVHRLTFIRDGHELSATLTYKNFEMFRRSQFKWLKPGVALITVPTFVAGIYDPKLMDEEFRQAAKAKAIVIDLRYNRGGALDNVFDLMGHVLPSGTLVSRSINRDVIKESGKTFSSAEEAFAFLSNSPLSEVRLKSDHKPYRGKLIVLTSHLAGSGGDRFPGTIKDLNRGTLIGTRTIGALVTGDRAQLSKGFVLLYPYAEVLMPSGTRIEGVGVQPDIELSQRDTLDDSKIFPVATSTAAKDGLRERLAPFAELRIRLLSLIQVPALAKASANIGLIS